MSSIITTARTELLPLHNRPPYGTLQSTTMSRAPLSPEAPLRDDSKLEKLGEASTAPSKFDLQRRNAAASAKAATGGVTTAHAISGKDSADERAVLARVNLNVAPSLHKRVLSRTSINASSKLIPRPAATPDVFAPEPAASGASPLITPTTTAAAGTLGKRDRGGRDPILPASTVKRSRADGAMVKNHREEEARWLSKWLKVFPTLHFHFEMGVDSATIAPRVLKAGARIDQFFSQRVSHLIIKGSGETPQKPKAVSKGRHPTRESDNPFLDQTGTTDLVLKAEKMGIKVWTVKKLTDMLNKLAPEDEVTGDSLSHLLADEKLNGTRERDLSAPRPDYYYFKPGNKYMLVEDATGRHRPIMIKEYPAKEREWPVLHEHFLRFTSSSQLPPSVQNSHNLPKDLRARAMAMYVDQVPFRGEEPPAPSLKRSSSMRDLAVTPQLPETLPYLKASGNSVVITSNIASTSTANATPGVFVGGVPALGTNKDRAIMQMSKRVQVLKGNARLAATVSAKKYTSGSSRENTFEATSHAPSGSRRRSTGMDAPAPPVKEFLTQGQVVAMLHQLRAPTTMTKPTFDERVRNREQVDAGYKRKEQDTASGYCENCRIRYTDLSVHIASKKHRRFATNHENFADLDDMLACLRRPPSAVLCVPSKICRPCNRKHDKNAECGRCMDDPGLYSSSPARPMSSSSLSSRGSSVHGSARKSRVPRGAYDDGGTEDEDDGDGFMDEGHDTGDSDGEAWELADLPLAA